MKITIWDLDYYYAKNKTNCFNPTAMRVSSYHKQMGDQINFVQKEDDIRRPFDYCYIFKNNAKTPNPPKDFFFNSNVRFLGTAFKVQGWSLPPIMLAVRPDYLLYPEKNTIEERSEYIQLFDIFARRLPQTQDYTNSFKGMKRAILTDRYIWRAKKKSLIAALQELSEVKNLSFSEPIDIEKIYSDKDIKEAFFKLKLTPGARLSWCKVSFDEFENAFQFLKEIKKQWPRVATGVLEVYMKSTQHWDSWLNAYRDFVQLKSMIVRGKKEGIPVALSRFEQRLETPYFFLFETISEWTRSSIAQLSWLEYISKIYHVQDKLNQPQHWNEMFRDLLRQTYEDTEFLLLQSKENYVNKNNIPWEIWKKEFTYGI